MLFDAMHEVSGWPPGCGYPCARRAWAEIAAINKKFSAGLCLPLFYPYLEKFNSKAADATFERNEALRGRQGRPSAEERFGGTSPQVDGARWQRRISLGRGS